MPITTGSRPLQDQCELSPAERKEGIYMVTLRRDGAHSVGMRLVQKLPTHSPFVADIDPSGPAANTAIKVSGAR